eukprot:TRINITY_DN362_c2_g2_i5.p1 TRINITY_DN362_c2_g2~~TRINITY_DN362_c2_g2_i5.p1  ORF type:complete len:211 (-),score=85.96 TRINITY_DN362_c2_g2_i5:42-674(-)
MDEDDDIFGLKSTSSSSTKAPDLVPPPSSTSTASFFSFDDAFDQNQPPLPTSLSTPAMSSKPSSDDWDDLLGLQSSSSVLPSSTSTAGGAPSNKDLFLDFFDSPSPAPAPAAATTLDSSADSTKTNLDSIDLFDVPTEKRDHLERNEDVNTEAKGETLDLTEQNAERGIQQHEHGEEEGQKAVETSKLNEEAEESHQNKEEEEEEEVKEI